MQKKYSLERIRSLVADLEQELEAAPSDSPKVAELRAELYMLKGTLEDPEGISPGLEQQLHGVRSKLDDVVASVEGEVLKDTPYLAELGRILGLV